MMKSRVFNKILLLFILSFVFVGMCYAEDEEGGGNTCLLEDRVRLREEASKIKVSYEPETIYCVYNSDGSENCNITAEEVEQMQPFINYGFIKKALRVKIYNLPEDMIAFAKVAKQDEVQLASRNADENGVLSLLVNDTNKIQTVNITFYGSKSPCYLYKVRTIKLTLPKINPYSVYTPCDEISDYYVCQDFITFDMDFDYFHTHAMEYYNKIQAKDSDISLDDDANNNSYASFLNKNKYLIIIVLIVVGIGLTAFIMLRRRNINEKE